MIARLQPGVTLDYAWQRLDVVNKRNTERLPKLRKLVEDAKFQTKIAGMRDELVKNVLPTLYPVAGGGSIRAADRLRQRGEPDAGARANVRMKELAIRFSLGAGRMRMARQLLTESLTLAVLGGLVGYAGLRALLVLGARELPRGGDIRLSGGALAFSAGIAVLKGLVFGLAPVFHLYRRDLNEIFRGNERAGLLTLSFARLLKVDPGFKPQHVLSARISLPPVPFWNFIDAGYFQTMGIPLLQGRTIAENDRDGAPLVAVIDQHMARKYWPKGDAVGARVRMGLGRNPPWTIIGIVGSVKKRELAERDS